MDQETKILYVEDDLQKPYEEDPSYERLTSKGWQVDVAECGGDAWRMLEQNSYDLVLLDIMLPRGSNEVSELKDTKRLKMGIRLFKEIRKGHFSKNGTKKDVPIVVLTAVTLREVLDKLKEMVSYERYLLTKPTKPSIIVETIEDALSKNKKGM